MNKTLTLLVSAFALSVRSGEMVINTEPVRPETAISLFNGRNLSGWTSVLNSEPNADKTWSVKNGAISCTGQPFGYLMTQQSYTDYRLHIEYRWTAKSEQQNSGIFVHKTGPDNYFLPKSIETQLKHGNAGDFVLLSKATVNGVRNDGNKRIERLGEPSENAFGEWNSVDIEVKGKQIRSYINGVLQNVGEKAYTDSGNICLQSEGGPIEFRNITIKPIRIP
ncbi:MAG: DUF1080 domain-containing protein [Kiritimatiellia bacterium]